MTWLVVALALVLAIGPVLYLLPSKSDQYLSTLRLQARKIGLNIQMGQVPKLDPSAEDRVTAGAQVKVAESPCAGYQLPFGRRCEGLSELRLIRLPAQPTVPVTHLAGLDHTSENALQLEAVDAPHPPPVSRWGYIQEDADAVTQASALFDNPHHAANLAAAMAKLPIDVLAVGLSTHFVTAFWLEKAAVRSPEQASLDANLQVNDPFSTLNQLFAALTTIRDLILAAYPSDAEDS